MHTPSRRDLLAGVAGLTAAALVPRPRLHAAEPDDRFFQDTLDQPIEFGVTPVEIRPGPTPAALPVAPVDAENATARFHNLRHNGRMGGPLLDGTWRVRWTTSVFLLNQHGAILHTGDRIVVHDWRHWKLFDIAGVSVNGGSMGDGEIHLDPAHQMLYFWNPSGEVEARRLADGERAFLVPLSQSKRMSRATFLARVGRRLVAAGSEQSTADALGSSLSCIHAHDLGEPPRMDAQFRIQSPLPGLRLLRKSPVLVALSDERLFLATPRWFYRTDLGLYIEAAWTGAFEPLAMSMDEAGRVHAIVRASNRLSLWVLSPQGELIRGLDLPPDVRHVLGPPAIGYDHRTFVLAPDRVVVARPDKEEWYEVPLTGGAAGWGVTAGHRLLLSKGMELVSMDASAQRTVLHSFDAPLATSPVLTSKGELLVASARKLYCLTAEG
jgi:hypothetical protein